MHTPKKFVNGVNNIGPSSCVDNEMDINYAYDGFGISDLDASYNEKGMHGHDMHHLLMSYTY